MHDLLSTLFVFAAYGVATAKNEILHMLRVRAVQMTGAVGLLNDYTITNESTDKGVLVYDDLALVRHEADPSLQ